MAEDRSLAYALADNIIGFDDGYDSLLERGTKAVRKDPMGVARQLGGSLYDSVKDFAGAFARNPAGAVTDTANELGLSYVEAGQRLSGGIGSYLDQGMSVDEARDAQLMDALTMSELLGGGLFANQLRKGLTPNVDAVSAGPDDPSRRKFMAQAAAAIPVAAVAPDVITISIFVCWLPSSPTNKDSTIAKSKSPPVGAVYIVSKDAVPLTSNLAFTALCIYCLCEDKSIIFYL